MAIYLSHGVAVQPMQQGKVNFNQGRLRTLFLTRVPPNREVFFKGCDYGEKVDLSKGYWNPKRTTWVATHFSVIIKQP